MYTALIQGLCKNRQIFKASKFFSDMQFIGLKPDVLTYAIITCGFFGAKHMVNVMILQADMLKMGIIPNGTIYQALDRGYREIGDLRSALRCSEDLLKSGLG